MILMLGVGLAAKSLGLVSPGIESTGDVKRFPAALFDVSAPRQNGGYRCRFTGNGPQSTERRLRDGAGGGDSLGSSNC